MASFYSWIASAYFLAATVCLMVLAIALFGIAFVDIALALRADLEEVVDSVLDATGLIIIGFAIIETAKFIAEEELYRKRELRSTRESRRSLTKFVTIIVIAASLEALVMIFKTSRTSIPDVIYPAILFIAAMLGQTALGIYQWLSSRVEGNSDRPEKRGDM